MTNTRNLLNKRWRERHEHAKSKQLLEQTRRPLPGAPGHIAKEDYEYKRAGTRNLFVAVEPKAGHREVEVTHRRTKPDFVAFVQFLALEVYAKARKLHLVLDNLNTHFQRSEQTATFSRDLRKFLPGSLLDAVVNRKMKFVQSYGLHAVEVFAEMPGRIIDFPIRESPQGDF